MMQLGLAFIMEKGSWSCVSPPHDLLTLPPLLCTATPRHLTGTTGSSIGAGTRYATSSTSTRADLPHRRATCPSTSMFDLRPTLSRASRCAWLACSLAAAQAVVHDSVKSEQCNSVVIQSSRA